MMSQVQVLIPKVLIVSPVALDAQGSDIATFMLSLVGELEHRGYPFKLCVLASNADGSITFSHSDTVETVSIQPALPFTDSFESRAINVAWSMRHALRSLLAAFQPEVISVHDSRLYLPFHFIAQKVQVTLHNRSLGMAHPFDRTHAGLQHYWEQKLAATRAQAVVLHSQASLHMLQRDVLSQFDAVSSQPTVFPIGLNAADYPARKKRLLNGKIVLSYIGGLNDPLHQFKRFVDIISALPELYRKYIIEARVYSFDTMPEDIRQKQFSDIIFYNLNNEVDVISALQQTDILLLPRNHDGTGILALQAMLSNCKVIAVAGTAMDEYLEPDSYCAADVQSMADKLQYELDHIADIRALQDSNYFRALVDVPLHDVRTMADSYISVWQSMAH
jgi:glycosyltransferase involved in cell wall biosynthesis